MIEEDFLEEHSFPRRTYQNFQGTVCFCENIFLICFIFCLFRGERVGEEVASVAT